MLFTLPISLTFVVGLISSATQSSAAPFERETSPMISIPIAKRAGARSHFVRDTDQVDFSNVANHIQRVKDKYAVTRANLKNSTGLSKRAATSVISLTDEQSNDFWAGTVKFGGKSVTVDFDTGSSDTLLDKDAYTPSSSATNTGKTFSDSYGTSSSSDTYSGTIYQDTFSSGSLSLKKASIGRITSGGDIVEGVNGLVGLAYPSLSSFGSSYLPLFDLLIDNKQVSAKEFGFALATSGSTLDLGGYDSSKYSGSISYTTVTQQAYWEVAATINSQSISAVVDSGTTLILGPTSEVETLLKSLKGVSIIDEEGDLYGVYSCSSTPSITLKFGSKSVPLTSAAAKFGTTTSGKCILSVVGTDIGEDIWIVGDPLFRSSYVAFSRSKNAVGFATLS